MKTLTEFLAEKSIPIDDIQEIKDPSETKDAKRKLLKVKNKVLINPDYSTYQARTHKDSDIGVDGKSGAKDASSQSSAMGTNV
jgi:hypothetical protein